MRGLAFILLILVCACNSNSAFDKLAEADPQFDLAIMGGTIIDGSGMAAYEADVLVRDGKIAFIGEVEPEKTQTTQTINAKGKVVSPGFIDVHAHGNPLANPYLENFLAQGVTTIFLGQDGYHPSLQSAPYDLLRWMDSLEIRGVSLNVALMAGHGSLRRMARIADEGDPAVDQLTVMSQKLQEALEGGCYGLSTGLEYVPGMFAGKEELAQLAKILGEFDAVMASHMRNEDDDAIETSLAELLELGAYCPVHASHLKVVYGKGEARGEEIIDLIQNAREGGKVVTADVYPYTASYTGIGIVFPKWAKTRSGFEKALKTRKIELEEFLQARITKRNGPESTLFGSGPYAGKTLAQAADQEGMSFVELLLKVGPLGASGAYFIMDEPLQDVFIEHPEIMIASDGSPTMLHPRGHGSQARIIEKYVVNGTMELEQAVHKMSGLPAKSFGIKGRGQVSAGYFADLVVFDPELVVEKATYADPYQLAEGFDQVIVNGVLVRNQGAMSLDSPGQVLRKSN